MYIPFIGRLSLREWPFLIISLTLVNIEYIITLITDNLPDIVIQLFTTTVRLVFSYFRFTPNINKQNENLVNLHNCKNINEMVEIFGFEIQSHVVRTKDDYLLNVHRLTKNGQPNTGKVVYFHHGLLMNSEIWCTMLEEKSNLPFNLFDKGYDVWLGNNRGNKYSNKHVYFNSNSLQYWDFSIDEFALFDIPDSINYILKATARQKVTYIGFSQGSAQAFASVSINLDLNDKIDKLIAISPATTPHGLYTKFVDRLLKVSPNLMYLMFGKRILLPSTIFWTRIMYPPLFNSVIDLSNYWLFNWKSANIKQDQKISSYSHLYSTTSVKSVVHWFQIISHKNFQMYKDELSYNESISYPLTNIKIPIYLIYGTADSLVDITVMKNQLPRKNTFTKSIKGYEHLENIWGKDIDKLVFPYLFRVLEGESVGDEIDDVQLDELVSRNNVSGEESEEVSGDF